jgi:hypothetical protein
MLASGCRLCPERAGLILQEEMAICAPRGSHAPRRAANGRCRSTPERRKFEMSDRPAPSPVRSALGRAVVIAGVLFALILIGIAATAWLSSDADRNLPFAYQGFDQGK